MERLPLSKQPSLSAQERWKIQSDGWHEQAWRQDEFLIGSGVNARLVYITGVMHDLKTFEMHRPEIEETVKKSGMVLCEGYATRDSPGSIPETFPKIEDVRAFREKLANLRKTGTLSIDPGAVSDDDIRRELVLYREQANKAQEGFYQFYDRVRQLAALYRKPLAIADPMHLVIDRAREKIETGEETKARQFILESSSAEQDVREGALYGGLMAGALAGFLSRLAPKSGPVSRRSFLKLAGAGAAVAGLGGTSILAEQAESAALVAGGSLNRESNPLGMFRYNSTTDYREVCVGLALDRLERTMGASNKPIAVFFGANHIDSIRHYATSPTEARLRLRAYPQQIGYAKPLLTIYNFDQNKREWVLGSQQSILE